MKRILCLIVVVVLCVLPALPGWAAGETTIMMEEIVVTATRDAEEIQRIPANVTVITAEEIERLGVTSVVEVLENVGSINLRSYSGNPSQTMVDLRGFGGDNPYGKVLILLDGRRLNRPDMASVNWLQIPVATIERIEVVRGSGSVLYGDSAVAGVISIITKRGEGKPETSVSLIMGSYGLHDERVAFSGAADKFSYALTGENQKTSGYRERSEFSSKGGGIDLGYDASDYLNISLGLTFNKTDFDLPGTLSKTQMEENPKQYQPGHSEDDTSSEYLNMKLCLESVLGDYGQFDVDFLYGNKNLESNMPSQWSDKYNDYDIDTVAVTPKYVLEKDIIGHENKLMFGIDYYHETMDLDKYSDKERLSKTHVVDFTKDSLGYYLRDEFSIFQTLVLNFGYRVERAKMEGNYTNLSDLTERFVDNMKIHKGEAYEGGLTWIIGDKSKVFAKYSTVYRYPFLEEQAVFFGTPVEFLTDLDKEKGKSIDIGTSFYPLRNLQVGVTLYRIDMEDEIKYVGQWPTGKNENFDKTRHEGLEFSLSYKLKQLSNVYANFIYEKAKFREGENRNKELPLVPNVITNLGLEIYLPFGFSLRPEMTYIGDSYLADDLDNNTEKLKGYTLLDASLFYKPGKDKSAFSVFISVLNLTDEKYSTYGYDNQQWGLANTYYPSPGINIKSGVSFNF